MGHDRYPRQQNLKMRTLGRSRPTALRLKQQMQPAPKKVAQDRKQTMRLRISIRGAVQGVGFRPFIYRLATEARLAGWVNNSAQGVLVEVEGAQHKLESL